MARFGNTRVHRADIRSFMEGECCCRLSLCERMGVIGNFTDWYVHLRSY